MEPLKNVLVIWNKAHIEIEVESNWTLAELKAVVCEKTGIKPFRQRFNNLKLTENNIADTCKLTQLEIVNNSMLLLDGNLNEQEPSISGTSDGAAHVAPLDKTKILLEEINIAIQQQNLVIQSHPHLGKHLLVMDGDHVIYDCSKKGKAAGYRAVRPYLQQFLACVYEEYDIIIWSAKHIGTVMHMMQVLGIKNNPYYTILSYFDRYQMISMPIPGSRKVKDLEAVWLRFPQYNYRNTVICDDQPKNYITNPANGIQVTRYSYTDYENDKELIYLAKYLKSIANFSDVTSINHQFWKECIKVKI